MWSNSSRPRVGTFLPWVAFGSLAAEEHLADQRLNEEMRRRTRVARRFPHEAACLRSVPAILMETSEARQTAERRHVVFTERGAIEG